MHTQSEGKESMYIYMHKFKCLIYEGKIYITEEEQYTTNSQRVGFGFPRGFKKSL